MSLNFQEYNEGLAKVTVLLPFSLFFFLTVTFEIFFKQTSWNHYEEGCPTSHCSTIEYGPRIDPFQLGMFNRFGLAMMFFFMKCIRTKYKTPSQMFSKMDTAFSRNKVAL